MFLYIIRILMHSLHFIHSLNNHFLIYIFIRFCETFILELRITIKYILLFENIPLCGEITRVLYRVLRKSASIILQIFGAERIFTKILLLTKFNEPSLKVYGCVMMLIVRKIEFIAVALCCC